MKMKVYLKQSTGNAAMLNMPDWLCIVINQKKAMQQAAVSKHKTWQVFRYLFSNCQSHGEETTPGKFSEVNILGLHGGNDWSHQISSSNQLAALTVSLYSSCLSLLL